MNPNNPTLVPSSRNSQARPRSLPFTASRAGKLAACLILGVAALSQSASSQQGPAPAAGSFGAKVLADNPVAFWQLNESGGTVVYDFSPNALNATYETDVQVAGVYGPLAPYNGILPIDQTGSVCISNDVLGSIAIPALNLNTNTVTICMWIYPNYDPVTYTGLLMNRTSGGDAAGFGFGGSHQRPRHARTGLHLEHEQRHDWYNFNSGLYPVANQWQFVALVVQTNAATIYLYSVDTSGNTNLQSAVNAIPHDPEAFSSGGFFLGSDANGTTVTTANNEFPGGVFDAAVFNKALSSDQILALFAAGVGVAGFAPQITGQPLSQYVLSGSPAT